MRLFIHLCFFFVLLQTAQIGFSLVSHSHDEAHHAHEHPVPQETEHEDFHFHVHCSHTFVALLPLPQLSFSPGLLRFTPLNFNLTLLRPQDVFATLDRPPMILG